MLDETSNEIKESAVVNVEEKEIVEAVVEEQPKKSEVADNVEIKEAVAEPEVIAAPQESKISKGLGPVENGAMGSTTFVKPEPKKSSSKKSDEKKDTVAVHSTRNVTWSGVGKVYIGYNIVTKEASVEWLKRDHIRLATPEEVAKEFGL